MDANDLISSTNSLPYFHEKWVVDYKLNSADFPPLLWESYAKKWIICILHKVWVLTCHYGVSTITTTKGVHLRFTGFWMNSLVVMNGDQWRSSEFTSLVNGD